MDELQRRKQSFLLRLPSSIREQAKRLAHDEGTSLNYFIGIAVAEKISRMQQGSLPPTVSFAARAHGYPLSAHTH